jgi:hypothetical protein
MVAPDSTTTRTWTPRHTGMPAAMVASTRGACRRVNHPEVGSILLDAPPVTIDADRVELGHQSPFGGCMEAVLTGLTRGRVAELAARGVLA